MSEKYTPKIVPLEAADVVDRDGNPGWATRVKSAIARDGQAVRLGSGNCIEAQSMTSNLWQPIMLPGGGISFVDTTTAIDVLRMIIGEAPIPNVVTEP